MSVQKCRTTQRGFSLAEALVVVAIIGIISMVSVPQFITMYRSSVFKSALRQYMTDVRSARQRAISFSRRTMVSFDIGTSARTYQVWEWLRDPVTGVGAWVRVGTSKALNEQAYFQSTTFTNYDSDAAGLRDIVFEANGTVANIPAASGEVVLATDTRIPINTYRIRFTAPGQMKVM
jgi:prepilin-type N-terminal cleavage/methylation domain-containing protein